MKEIPYWIALSQLPRWKRVRLNELIVKFHHEQKISIENFFQLGEKEWGVVYGLSYSEISDLKNVKSELSNYAFLAEDLMSQGFEVIPVISSEYSSALKANLKASYSPAVLYIKGNKQIMRERSLAIVGSRDASEAALQFADNIARLASEQYKVVVSGFAKGVDKQALDSAIKYKGQSIIVLPQGVLTFSSGFKSYYRQIVEGDVLVLSIFFPRAPWKAELAMARNPIIYGLANEIYVAESSEKGGTWSGVVDGLRKNRKIFVRQPDVQEKNANNLLIQKGAIPVDSDGKEIIGKYLVPAEEKASGVNERTESIESKIITLLNGSSLTASEIIKRLNLDWTAKKLSDFLKKSDKIEVIKKKPLEFRSKSPQAVIQTSLLF